MHVNGHKLSAGVAQRERLSPGQEVAGVSPAPRSTFSPAFAVGVLGGLTLVAIALWWTP
jgi:hypothetical protein